MSARKVIHATLLFTKSIASDADLRPMYSVFALKVPAEVRDKHDKYARTVRNIRRRFHGTSCSDGCNFIVDPQVQYWEQVGCVFGTLGPTPL